MEVRIVDPEARTEQPVGVPGELLFRGLCRFSHYYEDPEATAAAIDADGWFASGDLLRREADGSLSFVGRLKDMLKVGGENVAPAEVEGVLITHEAVRMAQVVGAPDGYYGEVAAAFVELEPDAAATEEELISYCRLQLAGFKVPRHVRFVTEWPMSGTKIRKVELREWIAAELAGRSEPVDADAAEAGARRS
jgi:fatty-acyl-CoA synthase